MDENAVRILPSTSVGYLHASMTECFLPIVETGLNIRAKESKSNRSILPNRDRPTASQL